jgi:hypothetical protein
MQRASQVGLTLLSRGISRLTRQKPAALAQRQTAGKYQCGFCLENEPDCNAAVSIGPVFHADNRAKKPLMCRSLFAEWKGDNQAHPHEIMGHTGTEIEAIAREIAHFAHVDNVNESSIEGLHLNWQRHLKPFTAPAGS